MEGVCHVGGKRLAALSLGRDLEGMDGRVSRGPHFAYLSGRPACFAASAVAAGCLFAAALCHFAALGMLHWVAHNGFNPRYATTSVIMLQCALAVFAGMQWHAVLATARPPSQLRV